MMETMIVLTAIEQANDVGLYGADWFEDLGAYAISKACNGCGPEWMAIETRERLTQFLSVFFTAFCLHDCRFQYDNNGSREKFDLANQELEKNCLLLADDKYAWWNPKRYLWRHRARLVGYACREFGWSAWRAAYGQKNKEN